jgi:CobQ-like glutamine amidotransferase family enzyme
VTGRALRVVVVYPDLLGTYGDGGNGLVLAQRARWRGIEAELVQAASSARLPRGDIYTVGGGEDEPERRAAETLASDGGLAEAVAEGAVVLAVCAGFQIVGRSFPAADGEPVAGVGLLDVVTVRGTGPRAVGEVVARPYPLAGAGLPTLTGFENHAGVTRLGPGAAPLARITRGVGNGAGDGTEGAVAGRVVGTYLHGPVLARNPALADRLLGLALGGPGNPPATLAPLDDRAEQTLRVERLTAAARRHRRP